MYIWFCIGTHGICDTSVPKDLYKFIKLAMYLEMHVYFTLCKMLHVPNVRVIEKGQLEYEGHQYGGESHLKFDYVGP